MATRDFIKHVVSTVEPAGLTVGDEYYNPSNNILYKRVATNGTTPTFIPLTDNFIRVDAQGRVTISTNIGSSSITTGTLIVTGGTGISENLNVGGSITAGSIQNTPVGSLIASTGAFTTLSASSTVSGSGFSTYLASPPAIGGTVAAAGTFTTLTANGVTNSASLVLSGTALSSTAWTTSGIGVRIPARTYTDTSSVAGTVAASYIHSIASQTFASTNAITITEAANLFVGAPVAGTNSTLTGNGFSIVAGGRIKATDFTGTIGATTASAGTFTSLTATGAAVAQSNLSAWNTTTPGTGTGGVHLGAANATANAGPALTFGARDSSSGTTAQAGIYINSDGSYGTRMYFATTNNYTTGAITGMWLDEAGRLRVTRNIGSTSTTSGTLIITGGAGISENLYVGGTLTATNLAYTGTTTVSVSTISAAGTTQATATGITTDLVIVSTVAAGSGVRLPASSAGRRVVVRNSGANTLNIYPATGAQINSLAANVAFSSDTSTTLEFIGFSATQWYTVNATFA